MDLLTDFFIYRDTEDNTTNVIYRREDGDIGLLEVKNKDQRLKTSIKLQRSQGASMLWFLGKKVKKLSKIKFWKKCWQ